MGKRLGGRPEYGLGLVLLLAVFGVPIIMISVQILQTVFGRDYMAAPWTIAKLLVLTMLVPLVAGMVLARVSPSTARRLEGPIERVQRWLLPIAMVVLLVSAAPDIWSLVGNHTLAALGVFVISTFAAGHLLGGPDRRIEAVLAFATSCRHPATALALASANFPGVDEHAAIALYGVVTTIVGTAYTVWLRRPTSPSRTLPA